MPGLGTLDWTVIAVYGLIVIAIGAWANRRQRTTEDYFLGGRRMRWWAIGVSLVATSFSSAALIGGTGEGFTRGMGYLQLQLGDLLEDEEPFVLPAKHRASSRLRRAAPRRDDRLYDL